jgi:N,N-dimethylformamidase
MLIGYSDALSALPGEEIVVRVSTDAPSFDAELVRLIDRAARPDMPRDLPVDPIPGTRSRASGRVQETRCGSFGWVATEEWLARATFATWVWLMAPTPRLQGLIAQRDPENGAGLALAIDENGRPCLLAGRGARLVSPAPLPLRTWFLIAGSFDLGASDLRLFVVPDAASPLAPSEVRGRCEAAAPGTAPPPPLLVAAAGGRMSDASEIPYAEGLLNGKLEAPIVLAGPLDEATIPRLALDGGPGPGLDVLHAWDLGADPDGSSARDQGPRHQDLRLVNAPTRAMTGHRFTGRCLRASAAPAEFGAAHFHEDDLEDARWEPSVSLRLPEDLRSGLYAVRLDNGEEVDHLVISVPHDRRRRRAPHADVAYLVSTMTHLAYGNARGQPDADPSTVTYSALHRLLADHPEWGSSTYDLHPDGSGTSLATGRRPIVGLRPDYWSMMRDEPAYLGAELAIIGWLERTGVPYDVLCDHDLHTSGARVLDGYRVLVTSPHPEYCSGAMLDAVAEFQRGGASVMYLGGNGFYWVTTISPGRPHLIELRRGHSGGRAWSGEPGEGYHATTGEPGGLWRNRGRAPQRLFGVGFTAAGATTPWPGYRRLAESQDPRVAFMFSGLEDVPVGGEFLAGAAGNETDRMDAALGTPPHALRVATSEGLHDERFTLDPADILLLLPGVGVGGSDNRVRSDVVFFETGYGGAVFSVGSISWCEALSSNGYQNDVAQLTTNTLRRFAEPQPFTIPDKRSGAQG